MGIQSLKQQANNAANPNNPPVIPELISQYGLDSLWTLRTSTSNAKSLINNWTLTKNLTLLNGNTIAACYSRQVYQNPQMTVRAQLPDLSQSNEGTVRQFFMGFENGGQAGNGFVGFEYMRDAANADHIYCEVANFNFDTVLKMDVLAGSICAANYKTAVNQWMVHIYKNMAIFMQNTTILAIIQFGPPTSFHPGTTTPPQPYGVAQVPIPIPEWNNALIEFNYASAATQDIDSGVSYDKIRVVNGGRDPMLIMPWIVSGTLSTMRGAVLGVGATKTSNIIPCAGYGKKTIRILYTAAGNAHVYEYPTSGSQRQISTTAIVANTWLTITVPDDVTMVQMDIVDGGAGGTINECDLVLQP